jgi:hypothetical protein
VGDNSGLRIKAVLVRAGGRLGMFIDGRTRQVAGFAREPSDSQIDGDSGLAAKGRQLERARL